VKSRVKVTVPRTQHPLVGEVRGKGLLAAVELVANKASRQTFEGATIGAFAQQSCQNNGLIVRCVAGSSIAFCPPLIITIEQADEIIETFTKSLSETLDFAIKEKLLIE